MENRLRIRLFGFPEICVGTRQANDFPTEKVRLLFFYLVLFRHAAHTRQMLAGLLWGNCTETRARHSLNTALWRLRRWLEGLPVRATSYLLIEDGQVGLNPTSRAWLDTAEFEERIRWARQRSRSAPHQAANALTRAVELYRGELLEGCYADWCLAERNRLHQLFLQALLQLMVYYGAERNYPQAIQVGQRILQDDPLREEVHREVMKLFALNHQHDEALRQYERCETALREELGIEPMPETRAVLHELISTSDVVGLVAPTLVTASSAQNAASQLQALLQRMDRLLEYLDGMRGELAQVIGVLKEVSIDTLESDCKRSR